MRSITFYSYKGGVGRTLALANVAHYLAQLGQRVVAIDLDLEAPGLHYKLKTHTPPSVGLIDLVGEFIEHGRIRPVHDWLSPVWDSGTGSIQLLSSGLAPSSSYWRQFASIDWRAFLVGAEQPMGAGDGLAFFLELKQRIALEANPDYLLMDARTGITELGGIASSVLADDLVCFFVRNDESIEGTKEILRALAGTSRLSASRLRIFPILARLPELEEEDDEREILADVSARLELAGIPSIEPIMIVHSFPALQVEERLLMLDDDPHVLESQIYADYARFFSSILPPDIAETSLQRSIEDAQKLAYKNPDEAQKILVRIAHRQPHVLSYRALLEFYRLRGEKPQRLIEGARKLAELSGDYEDDLVWSTVVDNLNEIASEPDRDTLRFVERAWRARGSRDPDVGIRMAEALQEVGDPKQASAVLMSLVEATPSIDGELLAKVILRLVSMDLAKAALQLSPIVRRELRVPALQRAWGRAVTTAQARDEAAALLAHPDVDARAFRTRPSTWFELLRLTGQQDRVVPAARKMADELIGMTRAEGLAHRHDSTIKQLYEALEQDELQDVFLQQLRVSLHRPSDKRRFAHLERRLKG